MSNRATRSGAPSQDVLSQLSLRDRLLFAQVVYELGSDKWAETSKLLGQHPLILRPKRHIFSLQGCPGIYASMMKDIGIDLSGDIVDEVKLPKAKPNLKLAQSCYQERVAELKKEILEEEAKFTAVFQDIQEIQEGARDDQIAAELQELEAKSKKAKALAPASPPSPRKPKHTKNASLDVPSTPVANPVQETTQPKSPSVSLPSTPKPATDKQPQSPANPSPVRSPSPDQPMQPSEPVSPIEGKVATEQVVEPEAELELEHEKAEVEAEAPTETVEVEMQPLGAQEEAGSNAATPIEEEDDGEEEEQKTPPRRNERRRATVTRSGKLKATEPDTPEPPQDRKRTREVSEITKDEEASTSAPKRPKTSAQVAPTSKKFQNMITMLLGTISQHKSGNLFHQPIKRASAPGYYDIVKRPMDLKKIKARIKDGSIADSTEFERDIYLMFANAIMFNGVGTIVEMVKEMMTASEPLIQDHRQSEGFQPH